jgi:hypothetical protein
MQWGLGCPQRGLQPMEKEIRDRVGIDDFCHWMHRLVILGIAPDGAQQRWLGRLPKRE